MNELSFVTSITTITTMTTATIETTINSGYITSKNMFSDITTHSWKSERREVTLFYGYLTFLITIVFIILLPKWNKISHFIYYKFLRFNRWLELTRRKNILSWNPMSIQMIIFWTTLLSFLSLNQTNWDLRFIAARLGRVPVYCLPTILFLTLRPSPLPNVLYLSLLPIHKWLSRIVIIQSLLHTICYIYLYTKNNTLYKLQRFDNLNGFISMFAFIIIILTSLPYIRRKYYNLFFINHYVCTWIVAITLYLHVRPGIPYLTLLNVSILLFQVYYKIKISRISSISVFKISNNMLVANLPNNAIANLYNLPGCHIRLIDYNDNRSKIWNYLRLFLIPVQHPYTLASLPADKIQKLIIRVGNYKLKDNQKYFITGSYLPHLPFIKSLKTINYLNHEITNNNLNSLLVNTKVKKCLIVVGGSAISFALPILRVLNYNGSMVKIIWIIRDHEDLKVLDYFKNYLINDDCIDIFITGNYTISEKINFKDALTDLHKRKMELELQQETEILSGGYSYYNNLNNNNEVENENINFNHDTSRVDSQSLQRPFKDFNKLNFEPSLNDIDHENYIENMNETTPLNHKLNLHSYGSSTLHSSLHPFHRKSCIEFRNHNKQLSDSYNTETVDIELNEAEIYKNNISSIMKPRLISSPAAGVEFSYNPNYDTDKNYNLNSDNKLSPLMKSSSDDNINIAGTKKIKPNLESEIKFRNFNDLLSKLNSTKNSYSNNKLSSKTNIPSSNGSYINQNLLNKRETSTPASSALYDDLEDYWVLKNSFSHIEFGRPKLGLYYYSWCIGSSCTGPLVSLESGQSICYNIREDPSSAYNDQINELYSNDTFIANRKARFKDRHGKPDDSIWVIGAGPSGLVDNVRLWANDCGFSFHEESFIV
jgi:hypothetical protein